MIQPYYTQKYPTLPNGNRLVKTDDEQSKHILYFIEAWMPCKSCDGESCSNCEDGYVIGKQRVNFDSQTGAIIPVVVHVEIAEDQLS